jgi:hypothetical protein
MSGCTTCKLVWLIRAIDWQGRIVAPLPWATENPELVLAQPHHLGVVESKILVSNF